MPKSRANSAMVGMRPLYFRATFTAMKMFALVFEHIGSSVV